jgi:hypothetical protein
MAIAERLTNRVLDQEVAARVARQVVQAAIDVGRTVFTPQNLKIHRYSESVEVTDMTNAGKRGKKVDQMIITVGHMASELVDGTIKNLTTDLLHMNYGQVKAHVEQIMHQQKAQGIHDGFRLREVTYRGVDVEPMGTTIELTNKFPDGSYLEIETSPHSFRVKDSTLINAPGKSAHGMHQDTSYWPVKKPDGIAFYGWAKDNLSKLHGINIQQLKDIWDQLGVNYNSH